MNQSKAFLTSMIFAVVAMVLVYVYVSEKENAIKDEFGGEEAVVVAADDIEELEEIRADKLVIKNIPRKFKQPKAQSDPKVFLNSGAVAAVPISKGEQVLLTKVLLKGAETGLSSQVAISRRAMSIPVTDTTGVTRLLKPGDRIDIVANVTYQVPGGGQEGEVKTLLQDIHVLAVGEIIQNQIPSVFEEDPITQKKKAVNLRGSRTFGHVTIEVTPLEAQALIEVMSTSELFLTLRNPVDRVTASIPTTTVDEVLGPNSKKALRNRAVASVVTQRAVAPPPPPPPPPNPWLNGGGSFK